MRLLRRISRRALVVAVAMIVPVVAGVTPANAASWQIVASPNPAGGRYDDLTGVSGTSASDIWSVGMEFVNSSHSFPIIEHYNGAAWRLVSSAQPTQAGDLSAVAALTPANVWAVGNGHTPAGVNAPMIQHYDGTGWTEVPAPVTTPGLLTGLAAVSASNIWAVGSRPVPTGIVSNADGLVEHAIVQHFNGTRWSLARAPDLGPNYPINTFNTVLALSPGNVWAIGQSATGNQTKPVVPLVEHFNGTRWTVQAAPSLSGNSILSFDGLVTTGSGRLWSVGSRNPAGTTVWQTLSARYS